VVEKREEVAGDGEGGKGFQVFGGVLFRRGAYNSKTRYLQTRRVVFKMINGVKEERGRRGSSPFQHTRSWMERSTYSLVPSSPKAQADCSSRTWTFKEHVQR